MVQPPRAFVKFSSPSSKFAHGDCKYEYFQKLLALILGDSCQRSHSSNEKRAFWLFRVFVGDDILPSYVGIIVPNYKPLHSGKLTQLAGKWTRNEDVWILLNMVDFPASYVGFTRPGIRIPMKNNQFFFLDLGPWMVVVFFWRILESMA